MGRNRSAQKQLEPANFAEASPPNWISIRISRRFADCDRVHSSGLYSEIKPSPPPPPPPSPRRPMQMQGGPGGREKGAEKRDLETCAKHAGKVWMNSGYAPGSGNRHPRAPTRGGRTRSTSAVDVYSPRATATGLVVRRELIHRFRVPNLYGSSTRFEARRTPFDSTLRNSNRNPAGSEFSS